MKGWMEKIQGITGVMKKMKGMELYNLLFYI